ANASCGWSNLLPPDYYYSHRYSCTGQTLTDGRESYTDPDESGWKRIKIFLLQQSEWHTRYCFRAKARTKSGGVVSENWSEWQCIVTSGPPPKPPAPRTPDADYYASNDLCAMAGRTAACTVVRWNPPGIEEAVFAAQKDWPGGPNLASYY